ncbi:MAG: flagellar protein FlaG [Burkholderiales bacterium]
MELGKVADVVGMPKAAEVGSKSSRPAPAPASAPMRPHGLDPAAIERALAKLNQMMAERATGVRFAVDGSRGRLIVSVIDTETNKILRQMPSEEVLRLNEFIDRVQGVALDSVA